MELTVKLNVRFAWWCKPFVRAMGFVLFPIGLVNKPVLPKMIDSISSFVVKYGTTVHVE